MQIVPRRPSVQRAQLKALAFGAIPANCAWMARSRVPLRLTTARCSGTGSNAKVSILHRFLLANCTAGCSIASILKLVVTIDSHLLFLL